MGDRTGKKCVCEGDWGTSSEDGGPLRHGLQPVSAAWWSRLRPSNLLGLVFSSYKVGSVSSSLGCGEYFLSEVGELVLPLPLVFCSPKNVGKMIVIIKIANAY